MTQISEQHENESEQHEAHKKAPSKGRQSWQETVTAAEKEVAIKTENELLALANSKATGALKCDNKSKSSLPHKWFKDIQPVLSSSGLVRGVIPEKGLIILYGDSNCGKTFIAIDLSFRIAMGGEWFGQKVKQGLVLYIAAEAGQSVFNRVEAFKKHNDLYSEDIPFVLVTLPVDLCSAIKDTKAIVALIKEIEEARGQKVELVIIDTVSRALAGGDENSPKSMGAFVRNLDHIRDEGECAVLAVHHSGKDTAKGARGHSLLRAAVDTEIQVENEIIKVTKQRDMALIEPIGFELTPLEIGQAEDGASVTSCVVRPRELSAAAFRARVSEKALQAAEVLRSLQKVTDKVAINVWRDRFWELHYAGSSKNTQYSGFRRATEQLFAKKMAHTSGGYAWLNQSS